MTQEFAPVGSQGLKKVLIVKTGYSETLDPIISGTVSLGDVFRTTVILPLFPSPPYHVTWLTDEVATKLLSGNPLIQRIIKVNPFTPYLLEREWFDVLINLEKDPGICALLERVSARERYGFRYDPRLCSAGAHPMAEECLRISSDAEYKRIHGKPWSKLLHDLLGREYGDAGYVLGYQPKSIPTHDVGFNHKVGSKFPIKLWPRENWDELERRIAKRGATVSWQQSENDIHGYIEWLNTCRVVVSCDSLGMHLAMALGKKTIALFGPTLASEVDDPPHLKKVIAPVDWPCLPCLGSKCAHDDWCMPHISVDQVEREVAVALEAPQPSARRQLADSMSV